MAVGKGWGWGLVRSHLAFFDDVVVRRAEHRLHRAHHDVDEAGVVGRLEERDEIDHLMRGGMRHAGQTSMMKSYDEELEYSSRVITSRWMKRSTSSRREEESPVKISSSLVKTDRRDQ